MPGVKGPVSLIRRWDADVGDHVIALAWSPDGARLAAAAVSGSVVLLAADTGAPLHRLAGHGFGTTSLAWSPDGATLATAGQDGHVRCWDTTTAAETWAQPAGAAWVEHVAWSPDGAFLASAAGKSLRAWSPTGERVREWTDVPSTIADLGWRPASLDLTVAAYGGLLIVDPRVEPAKVSLPYKGSPLKLAWSPNGHWVATGNQDATLHLWDYRKQEDLQMWGYPQKIRELTWDHRSRFLASGGGPMVVIWDCSGAGPAGTKPNNLEGHDEPLSALAYQRAGPVLASGGADGVVIVWQPETRRPLNAKAKLGSPVTQIVWAPDDRGLAVGTDAGHVVFFHV